jgi:hypothetical protein
MPCEPNTLGGGETRRLEVLGGPPGKLEAGKRWVRGALEQLARGSSVQMWWWERTGSTELALVLAGGNEGRVASVRFLERRLRAFTDDAGSRDEVVRRLIAAIEQIDAKGEGARALEKRRGER